MDDKNVAQASKKGGSLALTFCFLDESGFSEKPPIRKTWGKKGQTPIIQSTGSWKSLSVTGVIATKASRKKPKAFFTVKKGAVRSEDTVRTLSHLMKCVKGGMALFMDGLPAHRSQAVQHFLHKHENRFVMVERFPAYAPELNPQEYIWSASKGKDMANFCPYKDNDLHRQTQNSLRRIQRNEKIIQGALAKSKLFL